MPGDTQVCKFRTKIRVGHNVRWGGTLELSVGEGPLADKMKVLGVDDASPLAVFRTDAVRAHLPAGKALPYLYSTSDIPPPPPVGSTTTTQPAVETPRASYLPELNPELIRLTVVLVLLTSCLFVIVYVILSIED